MQLKLQNKTMKAQAGMGFSSIIWGIVFAVLAFAVLGLTITYTTDITQDVHDDQTADSYAANASEEALEAQTTIAEGQDSMANVIIAAAIISILIGAFGGLAYYGMRK